MILVRGAALARAYLETKESISELELIVLEQPRLAATLRTRSYITFLDSAARTPGTFRKCLMQAN